jgi:hypothetical protein
MPTNRHRLKWTVNELLQLQREYELLEYTIQDISAIHDRILYKLQRENLISKWSDARGISNYKGKFPMKLLYSKGPYMYYGERDD